MSIEFEDYSAKVKDALDDAMIAYLHEAGGELHAQIARNSKVDTGQTKGSYAYKVDEGKGEVVVGSSLQNAIWEEFGTGEYALHGDGRKTPWRYKDPQGEWHTTSGKHPKRPMFKAFESMKNGLIERFAQILQDKIGG